MAALRTQVIRKYRSDDYAFGGSPGDKICRGMAREVKIGGRRFYIVSEPHDPGWTAQVLEITDEKGSTLDTGIMTTGETRTIADDRALGLLQQRLREVG